MESFLLSSQGCPPNVVTYNTLIDVYGKSGQWEEAMRGELGWEQQGRGVGGRRGNWRDWRVSSKVGKVKAG